MIHGCHFSDSFGVVWCGVVWCGGVAGVSVERPTWRVIAEIPDDTIKKASIHILAIANLGEGCPTSLHPSDVLFKLVTSPYDEA